MQEVKRKVLSLFGRTMEVIRFYTGRSVDFDFAFGKQCVDLARAYAKSIGYPISTFSGSAWNGWKTGSPFVNTRWVKVEYIKGTIAPAGAIIFFKPTITNPYGHVAVVNKNSTTVTVRVLEQNAGNGSGDGLGNNKPTIRTYPYTKAPVGDVAGWYYIP